MNLKSILLASAFSLFAGISQAAVTADALAADFQTQGFTAIEVKQGPTQIKVEAIKDGMKTEVIYDIATGAILKTESHAVQAGDSISNGVKIRTRNRDFLNGNSGSDDSDDSSDDDSNDDNGGDDHDSDSDDDQSGHDGGDDSSHDSSDDDSHGSNDD